MRSHSVELATVRTLARNITCKTSSFFLEHGALSFFIIIFSSQCLERQLLFLRNYLKIRAITEHSLLAPEFVLGTSSLLVLQMTTAFLFNLSFYSHSELLRTTQQLNLSHSNSFWARKIAHALLKGPDVNLNHCQKLSKTSDAIVKYACAVQRNCI